VRSLQPALIRWLKGPPQPEQDWWDARVALSVQRQMQGRSRIAYLRIGSRVGLQWGEHRVCSPPLTLPPEEDMNYLLLAIVAIHGLIHLMGFAKAFGLATFEQLRVPISQPLGLLWLAAAPLFNHCRR
jgi:hypothetical protein